MRRIVRSRRLQFGRCTFLLTVLVSLLSITVGCIGNPDNQVVVYTALDQEFSQPVFDAFTKETGIEVLTKFDTESTKTVGLANALIAEAARPRCDVFWNNEILNTLRLEKHGLLDTYEPASAGGFPATFQDPNHKWHGFAARARVLIVNKERLQPTEYPKSVGELADERWKGRVGIAKPSFGTTATHAAVLFSRDAETTREFFRSLRANAQVMAGNKQVALAVARGQLDWGLTDTDDAIIEIEKGMPVEIVYPDQAGDDAEGTLFIPNTLSIIKDGPNPESARRLVDYLLRAEIELQLATGPSAQIPLAKSVDAEDERIRVETPQTIEAMRVSWAAAAEEWDAAAKFLRDEFTRGD